LKRKGFAIITVASPFLLPSAHCFTAIRLSPTFNATLNVGAAGQPERGYSTKRLPPQPAHKVPSLLTAALDGNEEAV